MKSTTVKNPAEIIEKRIAEPQEGIEVLQQQLAEKTTQRVTLSRQVEDCQAEIARCKDVLAALDKDLQIIAIDLADEAVDKEDALTQAKAIDRERCENRLLMEMAELALPILSDQLKQVSVAKTYTKTPEQKIQRETNLFVGRLRCWRSLAKHLKEGSNQSEHDFLRQCGMISLSRDEKIELDDVLRAVNKYDGREYRWSYTKVGRSV